MALTDSFNSIYNKKEQAKIERQKIKLHDELLEMELTESLQTLQLDYITENDKNMLLLPKTKNNLINEVIRSNNAKILKISKYIDTDFQKAFLFKKYDTITNKTLRLAKTFDKMQEEKEDEPTQHEEIIELNKKQVHKNIINWKTAGQFLLYTLLVPFFGLYILLKIINQK